MKKLYLFLGTVLLVVLLGLGLLWFSGRPVKSPPPESRAAVWVDGVRLSDAPVWDGETYVPLKTLAQTGKGSFSSVFGLRLKYRTTTVRLSSRRPAVRMGLKSKALAGPCRYYDGVWYAPVSLLPHLGMQVLEDPEMKQTFYSFAPDPASVRSNRSVVILRYHCVSDDIWGGEGLFMSPEKVEEQITAMEEMGCTFITFEDLDRIGQIRNPVLLTLDDGYMDNYTELFPILQRHNAKATIFVITGLVGKPYYLTEDMIREMDASGLVSFQSHTVTHSDMNELPPEEQEYEASASQLALARMIGKIPFAMSFPRARADEDAMACVSRYYQYVVIADGKPWVTGTDPLNIPRFAMPRDITMDTFRSYFDCFR